MLRAPLAGQVSGRRDGRTMAGRQDGIPIAEAAARLGLSAEAVRKRLQRGTLHGYKDDDGGWFVLPGDLHGTAGRQDTVRTDRQDDGRTPRPDVRTPPEEPLEAAYRVTPAEIAQAVSSTSAQYMGDLRTMLAEVGKVYEGQLAAKDETIAAKDAALAAKDQALATDALTIAELRRRAEVAEAELARRHEDVEVAQAASAGPHDEEAPAGAPGRCARRVGARAALVEAMRHGGIRAIAALLWRLLVALVFLLDPALLELVIRSKQVRAPVSLALVVLLLALVGGAIWRWTRRDPPDEGG